MRIRREDTYKRIDNTLGISKEKKKAENLGTGNRRSANKDKSKSNLFKLCTWGYDNFVSIFSKPLLKRLT